MKETVLGVRAAVAAFFTAVGVLLGWKGIMVLVWVALMAMDYITGTFAAMKAGQWNSRQAREGAWHKGGAIIVVMVAAIADGILLLVCGNLPVLNMAWPGCILPLLLAWYTITELGSILENAIKLGAKPPVWLVKILAVGLKMAENAGELAAESMEKQEIKK